MYIEGRKGKLEAEKCRTFPKDARLDLSIYDHEIIGPNLEHGEKGFCHGSTACERIGVQVGKVTGSKKARKIKLPDFPVALQRITVQVQPRIKRKAGRCLTKNKARHHKPEGGKRIETGKLFRIGKQILEYPFGCLV